MEITKLWPAEGRLLVRVIEQDDSDKTGLVMLNGNMTNYLMGEIIARCTHEAATDPLYDVGEKVLMLKYGGDEVVVAGEKLMLIEEINVIASIE